MNLCTFCVQYRKLLRKNSVEPRRSIVQVSAATAAVLLTFRVRLFVRVCLCTANERTNERMEYGYVDLPKQHKTKHMHHQLVNSQSNRKSMR